MVSLKVVLIIGSTVIESFISCAGSSDVCVCVCNGEGGGEVIMFNNIVQNIVQSPTG